jgi:hypothetical protein
MQMPEDADNDELTYQRLHHNQNLLSAKLPARPKNQA